MGDLIPVPAFGGDCDACFPVADTTPAAYEIIFFDVEACPAAQAWPVNWPSWILPQVPFPGSECNFSYQDVGFPPGWLCQYLPNGQAGSIGHAQLYLWYERPGLPVTIESHFATTFALGGCLKILPNQWVVCDCVGPNWRCGINGFGVAIPYPDPYPRKIITKLGWTDYETWLYERNFDANGWPVYRLHHADPWDTFSVKVDPRSPYS